MIGPSVDQMTADAFRSADLAEAIFEFASHSLRSVPPKPHADASRTALAADFDCPLCGSEDIELNAARDEDGPLTEAICRNCGCIWETNL